jgi:hypothetical protein
VPRDPWSPYERQREQVQSLSWPPSLPEVHSGATAHPQRWPAAVEVLRDVRGAWECAEGLVVSALAACLSFSTTLGEFARPDSSVFRAAALVNCATGAVPAGHLADQGVHVGGVGENEGL